MATLAINGGKKTIPDGAIKNWPPIDDTDRKAVLASLDGGSHAFGPNCEAFAEEFAAWCGVKHAVFTNSGTAALHMGLVACGVGAGDHVLVTAYSWSSSATCILHHNAIPIFVDINYDTINMDEDKLEAALTPRTKAIVAVNLHGLTLNFDKITAFAQKHNLKVIEDSCQAHGAKFKGGMAGTLGDCAAFSFNQNKCLCSGEGGMFVTDDEEKFKLALQLWSFGETRTPSQSRDYHAYALGWMYRGSDIVAAFGRSQLAKMDGYGARIRENGEAFTETVKNIHGLVLPVEPADHEWNYYNYTSRIDPEVLGIAPETAPALRDKIMEALHAEGVPVSVWQAFILPDMTVFKAKNAYGHGCPWTFMGAGDGVEYNRDDYPNALRHCANHFGMTVPLRAPNTPDTARLVGQAFSKVFENLDELK